ncbi:MAG: hypothetical protein ACKVQR_15090, partial [Aquabacterium sp.]
PDLPRASDGRAADSIVRKEPAIDFDPHLPDRGAASSRRTCAPVVPRVVDGGCTSWNLGPPRRNGSVTVARIQCVLFAGDPNPGPLVDTPPPPTPSLARHHTQGA